MLAGQDVRRMDGGRRVPGRKVNITDRGRDRPKVRLLFTGEWLDCHLDVNRIDDSRDVRPQARAHSPGAPACRPRYAGRPKGL